MISHLRNLILPPRLPRLSKIDSLYAETISRLPIDEQIKYCNRRLEQYIFELGTTKRKSLRKELKRSIEILQKEIQYIEAE
jgi:predicted DNA-binding protein YlxM (UPF0122 family)